MSEREQGKGGESFSYKQNQAATFLIQNEIVGFGEEEESKKTVEAYKYIQKFDGDFANISSVYVEVLNKNQEIVDIVGKEKMISFYLNIDEILAKFVRSSDEIYSRATQFLPEDIKKQITSAEDETREVGPLMLKELYEMIEDSKVLRMAMEEEELNKAFHVIFSELALIVKRITAELAHKKEEENRKRIISMPTNSIRVEAPEDKTNPIRINANEFEEYEGDFELETLIGKKSFETYQRIEKELSEAALLETQKIMQTATDANEAVRLLNGMINKFGVRFNNHDEIIREFKESPLKYELVKINFQRRLEKSVSKKSGFIITNENSDYK